MGDKTAIEWTDATLNPIRARNRKTGKVGWYCARVSEGCKHCYASTMNEWRGSGVSYEVPALKEVELFLDEKMLTAPLRWTKPRRIFICSMTDLFAEFVPDDWLDRIFAVMQLAPQHTFQVLTKRPERMQAWVTKATAILREPWYQWPLKNIWLGVSVEDQPTADERIPLLLQTPAAVRWVSYEPALGPVDFSGWLGYYPTHETDDGRGRHLSSGDRRGVGDRRGGANLEDRCSALESLDTRDEDHSLQAPTRGEPDWLGGLSSSPSDVEWQEGTRGSSSAGVASLRRADSTRVDNQPQERPQTAEPTRQPRIGDQRGASETREGNPKSGSPRSERKQEQHGETRRSGSARDSEASGGWRGAQVDSSGVRNIGPNSIEDRTRRAVGISWLVCGGESGQGARPFDLAWARSAIAQGRAAGVPVFCKQLGSKPLNPEYSARGTYLLPFRDRKGGDWNEWPADLRVREWPK